VAERFPRELWLRLFAVTDEALSQNAEIRVLGGGAVALRYVPEYLTADLDLDGSVAPALAAALKQAQEQVRNERGLPDEPLVAGTSVSNVPYTYEERYGSVDIPGLRHLRILVPERHDLALMKGTRALDKDLDALAEMHRRQRFDLPTLVQRYGELQFIGDLGRVRGAFLATVDRLFGPEVERALEPALERLDTRRGLATPGEWRAAGAQAQRHRRGFHR
jgi:hypothetical protein